MEEKISSKLFEIKEKISDLKLKLQAEIEINTNNSVSIVNLENLNKMLLEEKSNLDLKIEQIEKENSQLKNELLEKEQSEVPSTNKDLEIDFLVREIDNCINQIKTNL